MTVMATKMQRQKARRRSMEVRAAEQRALEEKLKRKAKAREEAFLCLDQVDRIHAEAGKALQYLLDDGDSREEVMELFDLNKGQLQGFLRAAKEYDWDEEIDDADHADDPENEDVSATDEDDDQDSNDTAGPTDVNSSSPSYL
jgi:hypothetical protein